MALATNKFSFLEQLVLEMLRSKGFDKLNPTDQETYFPQFMAEAERRLGVALLPHLKDEAAVAEFNKLLQEETPADAWFAFWNSNVPDFNVVVQKALENFAKEVSAAFTL